MKKTILASAIAAATFSGAVMAQESNMPTVYGNIQYAIAHDNIDGGPSSIEHFDNGSTLGVKHDHEIAQGVTGFFKLELDGFDADDKAAGRGRVKLDEAYIGVKGDNFGQLWVGSDDSTYERAVTEISEFYEVATLSQGVDYTTGEGDLVQYMSPSFGGLTLWGAVQVNGDNDTKGGDSKSYPYQLAAVYAVDALELAVAMDSNDTSDGNNENSYGLRASYNLDNLRLTGEFHTRKDVADTFGLMGVYTLGANQFALSYELTDSDNGDKSDTITLQALHNLSGNMYVYFEGYLGGGDEVYGGSDAVDPTFDNPTGDPAVAAYSDERTIAAIGAVYYF